MKTRDMTLIAVMAALMAAAISCNANLIAFFVAVLISVSSLYRFAVCLSTRKNRKNTM